MRWGSKVLFALRYVAGLGGDGLVMCQLLRSCTSCGLATETRGKHQFSRQSGELYMWSTAVLLLYIGEELILYTLLLLHEHN
jgi:hypothetical protein